MNTIRPRYPQQPQGYQSKQSSTDENGHNSNAQDQQQQRQQVIARGRAQDVQNQDSQLNQPRQPIYSPAANAYPQAFPNHRQTYSLQTPPTTVYNGPSPMQYQTIQGGYQPVNSVPQYQPNLAAHSIRNNRVNIAQILKDFRNTIKAIATPPEIEEQVERYLQIVNEQVHSDKPQVNLVQSNLKIAASLLDKYISETLNKESKVVQNWLDALFLQRIDYGYNEDDINPNFLVKFPENNDKKSDQPEEQKVSNETPEEPVSQDVNKAPEVYFENKTESGDIDFEPESLSIEQEFAIAQKIISQKPNITIIPQDTKLKTLFVEAKKYAFNNNPQKAMLMFKEAFSRAEELNDNETQSRICLEIGKIYDDNEYFVQALNSYNKSLQFTTDVNVKSRAHFSMAQIYDDVNQTEPALNHYLTSISYAGKSDDLVGQSDSLTKMANILTDKYNEIAFDYYDTARKLADQTTDSAMKGYVLSNTADACVQFKRNDKALQYYAEAVKNYEKTNSKEEIAQNYKAAAELMIKFNCPNKAKSLLKKALINAVKTSDEDLISEINMLLSSLDSIN